MLERIKNLFTRKPAEQEIEVNVKFTPATNNDVGYDGIGIPKPRNEFHFADAATHIQWVYTANTIRSEAAAMLPIIVYKKNDKKKIAITDDNVYPYKLISNPNPFTSTMELMQAIFGSLGEAGNAYMVVDQDDDRLWCLHPRDVSIIADKKNFIKGYVWRPLSGDVVFFKPEQIVHIKTYNPMSYFYGLSPIEACWAEVTQINSDELFWQAFWKEGGRLYGIFQTEGSIDKDTLERLKNQMKAQYGGATKMAANIVIDKGLKFQQIGVSQKDGQLIDKYKLNRDQILAAFKVPPALAGVMEYSNYSNVEAQERIFYQTSIMPMIKLVEGSLNNHPVMSKGGTLVYEFDISGIAALKEDEKDLAITGKILIESGQWTANEVRQKFWNMPLLADGNVLKPLATVPDTFSIANSLRGEHEVKEIDTLELEYKLLDDEIKKKELKALPEVNIPRKPPTSTRTKEVRDEVAKSYDSKLTPHDDKLAGQMRKVFESQKNTVLNNVRSHLKNHGTAYFKKGQEDDLLTGVSDYTKAIVAILQGSYADVIKDMGPDMQAQIQKLLSDGKEAAWDFSDPRVERFIKQRSESVAGLINDTTTQDLRDQIAFLFENGGGDLRTVSDGISSYFDGIEGYRAMRIARTETAAGAQEAIESTYQMNADVISGKEWITARDDQVRDSHQIDGQVVGLTDQFTLNDGETADYPLSAGLPAADSINCRCTTVPVLNSEGDSE